MVKLLKTHFLFFITIFIFCTLFNVIKTDLLVRSPKELKSQFISK